MAKCIDWAITFTENVVLDQLDYSSGSDCCFWCASLLWLESVLFVAQVYFYTLNYPFLAEYHWQLQSCRP